MDLPHSARSSLQHFFQAYGLAPWRAQRQWIGAFLLGVIGLAMTAALYLDVTSQAAISGRQIQIMNASIIETELANADMQSQLAESTSTRAMEERARALGYERVEQSS
jgi:hypothetical protein